MTPSQLPVWLAVSAAFAFASCEGERALVGPRELATSEGKPDGLPFMLHIEGLNLEVSAGALPAGTVIGITRVETPSEFSRFVGRGASPAFQLIATSPSGTVNTFTRPVVLNFRTDFDPELVDDGDDLPYAIPCAASLGSDGMLRGWLPESVGVRYGKDLTGSQISTLWPGTFQITYCSNLPQDAAEVSSTGTTSVAPGEEESAPAFACDIRLNPEYGYCEQYVGTDLLGPIRIGAEEVACSSRQGEASTACPTSDANLLGACVLNTGTTLETAQYFYLSSAPGDPVVACDVLGGLWMSGDTYFPTPAAEQMPVMTSDDGAADGSE